MTRILFWNLWNFNLDRITQNGGAQLKNIIYNITKTDPAIFSLIELPTGGATEGKFVMGKYETAAITLMNHLNAPFFKHGVVPPWKMVPPVVTGEGGKSEGVAVYYRSDVVKFTGPWFCTDSSGAPPATKAKGSKYISSPGDTTENNPSTIHSYPSNWNSVMLKKTDTEGGQWEFQNTTGKAQEYPAAGYRRPWLTTFREIKGGRDLEIFSFHAAFGDGGKMAVPAVEALAKTKEIVAAFATKTPAIRVVGGDFNLDMNNRNKKKPYDGIVKLGFESAFSKKPVSNKFHYTSLRAIDANYKGTLTTKITTGLYPNFSYSSSAYDQAFVKGHAAPLKNQMILNQVIGVDINYAGYPNQNAKGKAIDQGYGFSKNIPADTTKFTIPTRMSKEADVIRKMTKGDPDAEFRKDENYGHIRLTSDHMGIVVEV